MSACFIMRPAIGVIDGVNKVFQTPTDYQEGSVRVWASWGLWDQCVVELGGRDVEIDNAPLEGDSVFIYYVPR